MDFAFKTIHEFNDFFKDEKSCYAYFENVRWAGVPVCPHCASAKTPYTVKARGKFQDIPSYRCSERPCGLPFTVRTKSIFEGSKVELRKWFQAAYEISIAKNGISSVELGNRIGVSQKTAWFINHRLRTMLIDTEPELLEGMVEVDECYIGGKTKNKHNKVRKASIEKRSLGQGSGDKTGVVAFVSRSGGIRTTVLDGAKSLKQIVSENVAKSAVVITDSLKAYKGLAKDFAGHESVNHTENEYVRGIFHTNTVEGFFGQFKRSVAGTHIFISPQHTHRYAVEFATRYEQREVSNIERFVNIVKNSGVERVTYKVLTASPAPQRM